jgi:hypothetical protein
MHDDGNLSSFYFLLYHCYGCYSMINEKIEVVWLDSGLSYTDGWKSRDEIVRVAKLAYVTTVGTLFFEDDEAMYIALSVHENDAYGVQVIAKDSIKAIHLLTCTPPSKTEA